MLWWFSHWFNKEAELRHAPRTQYLTGQTRAAAGLNSGGKPLAAGIIFVTFLTVRLSPGAVHALSNGRALPGS
jgi:hypothetical protein